LLKQGRSYFSSQTIYFEAKRIIPPLSEKKEVLVQSFQEVNKAQLDANFSKMKQNITEPITGLKILKKIVAAFVTATILSVCYAAYDPGYRRTMRTTYPLGSWILDKFLDKEEEMVTEIEKVNVSASAFKDSMLLSSVNCDHASEDSENIHVEDINDSEAELEKTFN